MKRRDRIKEGLFATPLTRYSNFSITDDGRIYQWCKTDKRISERSTHRWRRVKEIKHEDGTRCVLMGKDKNRAIPIWVLMFQAHYGYYPKNVVVSYANGNKADCSLINLIFTKVKKSSNQPPVEQCVNKRKANLSVDAAGAAPRPILVKKA